jgi:hypothetical protein
MSDYEDPEDRENWIDNQLKEEATYTNKRLGSFPENEWIKTHPEFRECIIHTFENSDTSARVLFGIKGGAYSTVDILDGFNAKQLIKYDSNDRDNPFFTDAVLQISGSENLAKKVVENAINIFDKNEKINFKDIRKHIQTQFSQLKELNDTNKVTVRDLENHIQTQIDQLPQQEVTQPTPAHDRQLETAQKAGYVQGVCESVLAFNNDENRKIMSESTMTFLSKKILSEMSVTKDMAQKFANPETYKALEQFVFAPKQEQQLEQTQSRGRSM